MKQKYIYLIKAELEDIEYYKIGLTGRSPQTRLKELQTGNALKLELVCSFKTNYGNLIESTLHRSYSIHNESGEWFSLSNEQVNNFLITCKRIEENFCIIFEQNSYILNKKSKKF